MTAEYTWSYSALSLFQQCPKKYYELRVAKSIVEPASKHMLYGHEVHKAAELYVRDDTPLPGHLRHLQPVLEQVKGLAGETFCEREMALTEELEPCDFHSRERWWRGIADVLKVGDDTASVLDYKTGSPKYPDTKQLEILSLAVFAHHPEVQSIKAALLFTSHDIVVQADFKRTQIDKLWVKWRAETTRLGEAYSNGVWNPKPNFTCRGWCPVSSCSHWSPKYGR